MKYIEQIKIQVVILILMELLALALLFFLGFINVAASLSVFLLINITMILWIVFTINKAKETQDIDISRILGKEAKEAFDFGKVGIIVYDENYEVTWISDFLIQRGLHLVGKKATAFLPNIADLFHGEVDSVSGSFEEHIYEVARKEEGHVLFVKDITRLATITQKFNEDSVVVGIIHMDNYMDISSFEDESKVAAINTNLRQPIIEWADKYGMLIRRLRSDRFIVVLNEKVYAQILENKFDILNETRKKAQEMEVSITLSMAFARGSDDLYALDDMVNDLLELAQSRGGDQVAVKRYGGDVKYYGGNQEAVSKRSRVRVRVMAQAIKEAILESNQVFISGHKEMDFDAMGANLALSRIVQAYGKKAYIVSKSGGIESYLQNAMDLYRDGLEERHTFISDEEACRLKRKNDLMLVVDYHNPAHCNAPGLLEKADRIVVIDHHRRTENYIQKPLLVYIESGASSSCELITEFFPYLINDLDINEMEATIMYLGILVDTNRFKMRTGFRTFEAAAQLEKIGVDPIQAEDLLKEDYHDFAAKTNIFKYAKMYEPHMIIASVNNEQILSRTLMSMSADTLLSIKDVDAAFVIAKTAEDEVGISARSKGHVNVQRIMELMNGGGHFSAAATQRKNESVLALETQLKQQIDLYLAGEEENNESNTVE
ncbi:MAG: DHH family phosphoesterase [Erysipelotrichia bacterium]|nr:DHH family phosphoesterase [Erysipelotrichia bacterium]